MNDAELRRAMAVLESYDKRLEDLNKQVSLLQSTRDEVLMADRTLKAFAAAEPGEELLVPIGASSFVSAVVPEKPEAVIGVGTGVSLQKNFEDASAYMKQNLNMVNTTLEKAIKALQETQNATAELSAAVQEAYRQKQTETSGQ